MNWAALAAVASVIGLLGTIGVGVFVSGKLTQQVHDNGIAFKELKADHGGRLDDIDGRVNGHEVSLGRLHEWKDGFNAGARKLGSCPEAKD